MAQILNNVAFIPEKNIEKIVAPEIEGEWLYSKYLEGNPLPEQDYSHSLFNNWIVKNLIIGGPFPGKDGVNYKTDEEVRQNLKDIINSGVDTFVCLQKEISPQDGTVGAVSKNFEWAFPGFCNYSYYLREMYPDARFNYLHFPVADNQPVGMNVLYFSLTQITEKLARGHKIFIHCAGGHGRTGIYATILIGLIEGCSTPEAFKRNQHRHDARKTLDGRQKNTPLSPATKAQRKVAEDFLRGVGSLRPKSTVHK